MFKPNGPSLIELLEQAWSSTDHGYDLLAPKFELTPFCTPKEVLDVVGTRIGKANRGLDLCCGTGAGLRMLRQCCDQRIVGVDRSRGMLAQAQASLAETESPRVELVRADALAPPLQDAAFDVVTCFGAFGHILERDEPRFVREISRLLAPGGRFVFVTTRMPKKLSRSWILARG